MVPILIVVSWSSTDWLGLIENRFFSWLIRLAKSFVSLDFASFSRPFHCDSKSCHQHPKIVTNFKSPAWWQWCWWQFMDVGDWMLMFMTCFGCWNRHEILTSYSCHHQISSTTSVTNIDERKRKYRTLPSSLPFLKSSFWVSVVVNILW